MFIPAYPLFMCMCPRRPMGRIRGVMLPWSYSRGRILGGGILGGELYYFPPFCSVKIWWISLLHRNSLLHFLSGWIVCPQHPTHWSGAGSSSDSWRYSLYPPWLKFVRLSLQWGHCTTGHTAWAGRSGSHFGFKQFSPPTGVSPGHFIFLFIPISPANLIAFHSKRNSLRKFAHIVSTEYRNVSVFPPPFFSKNFQLLFNSVEFSSLFLSDPEQYIRARNLTCFFVDCSFTSHVFPQFLNVSTF